MKFRKLLAIILCVAIFMVAGTACNGDSNDSPSTNESEDDGTFDFNAGNNAVGTGSSTVDLGDDIDTSIDTTAPKLYPDRKNIKGEIKLFCPYDTSDAESQALFNAFKKKYPNTKLTVITAQWATQEVKLAQQIMSGNSPDWIYCTTGNFPSRAIKEYVQPLDKYIDVFPQDVSEYLTKGVGSWDGKIYGVLSANKPSLLYYNTTMFKNAGLETPFELWKQNKWTWAKFKEYAAELTDASSNVYGFGTDWEQCFLVSAGTDIVKFDKNGTPSLNIDDPKFKEALLFYYDGVNKDKIFTPTRWNNRYEFADGKLAMYGGLYGDYSSLEAQGFKNYGIAPMPKYDDKNGYVGLAAGNGWCVGMGAKNPEGGVAFAEFQYNWYRSEGAKDDTPKHYTKEVKAMVESITNRLCYVDNYGMYDSFSQAFGNFMRKNGDFHALLEENRPGWNKSIKDTLNGK